MQNASQKNGQYEDHSVEHETQHGHQRCSTANNALFEEAKVNDGFCDFELPPHESGQSNRGDDGKNHNCGGLKPTIGLSTLEYKLKRPDAHAQKCKAGAVNF